MTARKLTYEAHYIARENWKFIYIKISWIALSYTELCFVFPGKKYILFGFLGLFLLLSRNKNARKRYFQLFCVLHRKGMFIRPPKSYCFSYGGILMVACYWATWLLFRSERYNSYSTIHVVVRRAWTNCIE